MTRAGDVARVDERGFTVLEVLMTLVIGAALMVGLMRVLNEVVSSDARSSTEAQLLADAQFAMQRMTAAARTAPTLLVPRPENPLSAHQDSLREQSLPPVPGEEDATAVLAVTLNPALDRDGDGIADADNDGDGLIDEDPSWDMSNDGFAGLIGIDDDGDGEVDEMEFSLFGDDDEDGGTVNEDPRNGIDDDGDGSIDEDLPGDVNLDGAPGVAGADDDGDGDIDEGLEQDDDEDGASGEDWLDAVVFHIVDGALVERMPVAWDENGDGSVTGADFVELVVADHVSYFRVEHVPGRVPSVDVTLQLTSPDGQSVRLQTRQRVGGGK